MCIFFFFYRLFIAFGSNLLFIRHHMRPCLPLGLQLLEGRNTASASKRAWRHRHLSLGELHPHPALRSQGQGSCASISWGLIRWMSWEPVWDAPTHGDPCGMCPCDGDALGEVPAELECSRPAQAEDPRTEPSPRRGPISTVDHSHNSSQPSSPCPALFPLPRTGQPPRRCWLESTQDEQGFGLAPWSWSSRAMFYFHENPPNF